MKVKDRSAEDYFAEFSRCLLYPQKQTFGNAIRMSAKCQKQTFRRPFDMIGARKDV